jgi:cobalt/nickel transport system ATP-binding protein
MVEEILNIKGVKYIYPDGTQVEIRGLDFAVNRGERVVVLGPNGAGKTTLLSLILGLLKPEIGHVEVFGYNPYKEYKKIRKKIGVLFQNVDEQIIGPTVFDDIGFALKSQGLKGDQLKERVVKVAADIGIEHLLTKLPHYLSGGERKKVALAGAMVLVPELLILDEPFDGLDPVAKDEIISLLNKLNNKYKTAMVITTHDVNIVPQIADIIYVINKGSIIKKGETREIFRDTACLAQANLKPPVLIQLFNYLNKAGLGLDMPLNLKEAADALINKFAGDNGCF